MRAKSKSPWSSYSDSILRGLLNEFKGHSAYKSSGWRSPAMCSHSYHVVVENVKIFEFVEIAMPNYTLEEEEVPFIFYGIVI